MEYELTSSINEGTLEIKLSGKGADHKDAGKLLSTIAELIAARHPKHILIDIRSIQNRLGFLDAYQLIHSVPPGTSHIKTAIIDREEHKSLQNFYETTSENAGFVAHFFSDETAARTWLVS
ncbi:MAG: hypothetical protein JXA06_05135 [Bacteroidetes bacterium]|nr:hypothetical protein [Bacteroidota bacterium]